MSAPEPTTPQPAGQATPPIAPVPEHLHTVTPRLVASPAAAAIEFYKRAFGAALLDEPFTGPDGAIIHVELRIGDSIVMVTDASADGGPTQAPTADSGAIMATYWPDVDAAWQRALEAGAQVIYPLANHFYGERGGRLRDPYGQQWMLSQRLERLTREDVVRRAASAFGGGGDGG